MPNSYKMDSKVITSCLPEIVCRIYKIPTPGLSGFMLAKTRYPIELIPGEGSGLFEKIRARIKLIIRAH
jgi:hypothetical protein